MRSVIDLTGRPVVQVDVPGALEALDETTRGGYRLVVSVLELGKPMKGFELALRIKSLQPETNVLLVGDANDPAELDAETRAQSPFVYLRRPIDLEVFARVLTAGLEGRDIVTSYEIPAAPVDQASLFLPPLDTRAASSIIETLLTDVGAMAVVLTNRAGKVLVESGAVGYLDRERLAAALAPIAHTMVEMGRLAGGKTSLLQVFDGETYDVYAISVGIHYTMCLIFDGQVGARQLGSVSRYGRRAAEDLVTLLGTNAYRLEIAPHAPPSAIQETAPAEMKPSAEPLVLEMAQFEPEDAPQEQTLTAELSSTAAQEEALPLPLEKFDPALFSEERLGSLDPAALDDLFDPDKLAKIASETRHDRGPLTYDQARELGILP